MAKLSICCVSDTHGKHSQLTLSKYPADVLVHAGDWTGGKDIALTETIAFLDWFSEQPFEHKLFIAGNHERTVEANPQDFQDLLKHYPTIEYIHHKAVTISGINFYGSNYSNEFCDWAFMEEEPELSKVWDLIPNDTDVLVTHGPAYGCHDQVKHAYGRDPHVGSRSLHHKKLSLQDTLKLHISGHIHESYGTSSDLCINVCASVLNEKYQLVNEPVVITLH